MGGWVEGRMDGWMEGSRSLVKDCLQQSKTKLFGLLCQLECSSMVSIAALGPRVPGSNPGWFAISNSNQKLSFHK